MAIVLRNDGPKGRIFRYKVNGVVKSVWIDGYKEVVIEELDNLDAVIDKVAKAKRDRQERLSNTSTISSFLYNRRLNVIEDVSDEIKWRPIIAEIETGKESYVFIKDRVRYVFTIEQRSSLEVGTIVYNENGIRLTSRLNGDYVYNGDTYTITDGSIASVNGQGGESYTSWQITDSRDNLVTIYTQEGDSITTERVTVYANNDGTGNVTDGEYTYDDEGTIYTLTINRDSQIETVVESGR